MAQEPLHEPEEMLEELPNLTEKVFKIDLLREMILKNALTDDKDKKVCWRSVRSLRLVQKSWLETVTKLFENAEKPLFHLVLVKENSLIRNVGEEEGKLLNQFVDSVTTGSMSTGPSVPAFTLKISAHVFLQENRPSFSKILVQCGSGLVELTMDLPLRGGTIQLIFPGFSLPKLEKLTINPDGYRRTDNVSHFINNLVNAAPGLTHFLLAFCDDRRGPMDLQCFTLPDSITTLELDCYLTNANLDMLIINSLPQLSSLTLCIPHNKAFPEGLLFRILDKFQKTLRKLELTHLKHCGRLDYITFLGFPVMEELVEFSNSSLNCHLEPEMRSLETLLPKLSRLTLTNQTIGMFRKWTENRFPAVLHLKVNLADETFEEVHDEYWVGLNSERMECLHRAFPNVRKLHVSIGSMETDGLEYLFREMRHLNELGIEVVGPNPDRDTWEGLLIGAPSRFVAGLRESGRFWKDVQLTNHVTPSIKNLQELTSLYLEARKKVEDDSTSRISYLSIQFVLLKMRKLKEWTFGARRMGDDGNSLISDLAFRFALLKMPKLKELTLRHYIEMAKI